MRILIFLSFIFSGISLFAQTDSIPSASTKTSFIAGVSYNSSLHYYGRTDSLRSQGIYPFAGINFKNGLYVLSNVIFISNKLATEYAATIVEGGYRFANEKGNWSGNIFGSKYFYRKNIRLVQSAVKSQAGINLSNSNRVLGINFGADAKFSNNIDLGVFAGVDHIFRIENLGKGIIIINPSLLASAGTQRFSRSYLQQRKLLFLPVAEDQITEESNRFSILSYEISVPLIYSIEKINIILVPSYVLPQNLISVPSRPDLSESGKNIFSLTASIRFSF